MKQTNKKKGFTIVELVIVIAVIGILSAVLIPTFSGLINKANNTARQEGLRNAYTTYASQYEYAAGNELYSQDKVVFVEVTDKTATAPEASALTEVWTYSDGTYTPVAKATTGSYVKLGTFNGYHAYGYKAA